MKRLTLIMGIVILVLILTVGYTIWLHNDNKITYNTTTPAVMLNLSRYANDKIEISFDGYIYQGKLAENMMFAGTLTVGDEVYKFNDETVLELRPLKGDDYHGTFVIGEDGIASIIVNASFTKGFIKYWNMVDVDSDDALYNQSTVDPQMEEDHLTELSSEEYESAERYVLFPYNGDSTLELKRLIKDYEDNFVKDFIRITN